MRFFSKEKFIAFATKHFSFESGIDLSDEVGVLYRRNIVIKNIIFLSNIVYSAMLFVITFGSSEPGSWLFTVIPFPFTFLINRTVKRIINQQKDVLITQQVGMYMLSFYMFLSAILLYLKLSLGVDPYLSNAAYMLIYYALIVVSLYQSRAMLRRVFTWVLPGVTMVHLLITHNLFSKDYSADFWIFVQEFFTTTEFRDIAFRTVILGCFMIAVYVICVIGEKMSEARTLELGKRQDIQKDFTGIVTKLFDVLITSTNNDLDNKKDEVLYVMTEKLSSLYGNGPSKGVELAQYAVFLSKHRDDFKIELSDNEEFNFDILRKQSELGIQLVERIELANKIESIARHHIGNSASPRFTANMNKIQRNIDSQIISLADLYITLRESRGEKRPYTHEHTMSHLSNVFHVYFDQGLLERFVKFQNEFEFIYDNAQDDI